jgi:hypothetical protein
MQMSAGEWFALFWTAEDWENLATNTNAYATKMRTPDPTTGKPPRPLYGKWRPVTVAELKAFIGITIVLGVYRVRSFRDFWRQKGELRLGKATIPVRRYQWKGKRHLRDGLRLGLEGRAVKWISNIDLYTSGLSCKRYTKIKRYLHVSDPAETYSDKDWYKKVEPLNSNIRQRSQALAVPATNTAVDEMMARFFGRSKDTVRMPAKPIKEGYKIFALCQAGYTYNWLFHSRTTGVAELPAYSDLAPTQALVYHLACSLPYDRAPYHFNVYMDNLFTTPKLLVKLRDQGIGGAGTARSNAFPAEHKVLGEDADWNTIAGGATASGKVCATEWQDQRTVHMLSTLHPLSRRIVKHRRMPRNTSTNGPRMRKAFTSTRMKALIPTVINDYNFYKSGVDRADQYRASFFTQQTCYGGNSMQPCHL